MSWQTYSSSRNNCGRQRLCNAAKSTIPAFWLRPIGWQDVSECVPRRSWHRSRLLVLHSSELITPRVVLPSDTIKQIDETQIESVLSHELAHHRRRDLWWNLLPAAVQSLFFFHPLVWYANRRLKLSGEMACDAMAVDRGRFTANQYAECLLRVAISGSQRVQTQRLLGCVSVVGSAQSLKQRVHAMNNYQLITKRRALLYAFMIGCVGIAGVAPWRLVHRSMAAEPSESIGQEHVVRIERRRWACLRLGWRRQRLQTQNRQEGSFGKTMCLDQRGVEGWLRHLHAMSRCDLVTWENASPTLDI